MHDLEIILRATHLRTAENSYLTLEEGRTWLVGRSCASHDGASWTVSFDPALSRRHMWATLRDGRLWIESCENRHPLSVAGETKQNFSIGLGESFLTAHTVFKLEQVELQADQIYKVQISELLDSSSGKAQRCLSALVDLQPILSTWREPRDFFKDLLLLLRTLVPEATSLQVFQGQEWTIAMAQSGQPMIANRILLQTALTTGESQFQRWENQDPQSDQASVSAAANWALACPIDNKADQFILYVAGVQDQNIGSSLPENQNLPMITLLARQVDQYFSSCRTAQLQAELWADRRQRLLCDRLGSLSHRLSEARTLETTGLCLLDALHEAVPYANAALLMLQDQTACPVVARPTETVLPSYWSSVALDRIQHLIPQTMSAIPLSRIAWNTLFPQADPAHQGLLIPLFSQGRLIALIAIGRLNELSQSHTDILTLVSSQASAAVQNASLLGQVGVMVKTDDLTGLHSRRHFFELAHRHWEESISTSDPSRKTSWMLLMDIDHFKDFNEKHGQEVGDKVLKQTANICKDMIPASGLVSFARLDGNQFGAISLEPLDKIAEDIRCKLHNMPMHSGQLTYQVQASFGVARQITRDETAEILLKRAENSLQSAKQTGRNRVVIAND